ncbi:MAG: DMT family transporter [Chloroflexota bacterium]|nr:DMT family transporter [Chloroflexota bacterium]
MGHPNDKNTRYKPIFTSLFGILFVSTASIFIRVAQVEASSIVIAASRLMIASIVLVPIALSRYWKQLRILSMSDVAKGFLSGVFLAMHFAAWISSLEYTSVASSVVLVTTTPLWVALLSPLVLKESIRKSVIIGLLVSMVGGVLVGLSNTCVFQNGRFACQMITITGRVMLGNFLALFGAWMAAGYMLIGRQLRKHLNTVAYTAMVYGIAAIILSFIVIIRAEQIFTYSSQTYICLLALGILPQLFGHTLFNWALKYVSAAFVSLTLLGEAIGTIILALIFLKESPTLLEGAGAVLIMIGILVGSVGKDKPVNVA